MNQEKFLNNEKVLLEYLRENLSESKSKYLVTTDKDLALALNVSTKTVSRWRNRLLELGLIKYSSKWVSGKKQGIFEV